MNDRIRKRGGLCHRTRSIALAVEARKPKIRFERPRVPCLAWSKFAIHRGIAESSQNNESLTWPVNSRFVRFFGFSLGQIDPSPLSVTFQNGVANDDFSMPILKGWKVWFRSSVVGQMVIEPSKELFEAIWKAFVVAAGVIGVTPSIASEQGWVFDQLLVGRLP